MDGLLHAVEANWVALLGAGVVAAFIWACVVTWFGNQKYLGFREGRDLFPLHRLEPDIGEPDILKSFQAALVEDRRKSFWPNLWLNLFTNFLTNLVFFILGVVVTLYLSQPH